MRNELEDHKTRILQDVDKTNIEKFIQEHQISSFLNVNKEKVYRGKTIRLIDLVNHVQDNVDTIKNLLNRRGYRLLTDDDIHDNTSIEVNKLILWDKEIPWYSLSTIDKNLPNYNIHFLTDQFNNNAYYNRILLACIPIIKIDRTVEKAYNRYYTYPLVIYGSTTNGMLGLYIAEKMPITEYRKVTK